MRIKNKLYRTIWLEGKYQEVLRIIDQTKLPYQFKIVDLHSVAEVINAINTMQVRGAPLIGVAAAYGMYLATLHAPKNNFVNYINKVAKALIATRPTAINLAWAVKRQLLAINSVSDHALKISQALSTANIIAEEDIAACLEIGKHGFGIINQLKKPGKTLNILTHCNAGWLATVDYGTALAPIYLAFDAGIDLHVWVSETRPRNQGAKLTAWELLNHGVPHHVIADNACGHLIQHGMVDLVLVGADRVTRTGDVANKVGTYLKALAAYANHVPFYVAFPSSTFDLSLKDGVKEIPIEERDAAEIKYLSGACGKKICEILLTPKNSPAINYGFDVTPARYITGLITECGVCQAREKNISTLMRFE